MKTVIFLINDTAMIPDVKLQQLRYFVLVADLRSYHAAAERASRTQPAISLSIRELEERLGQPLFERGNKTELTPYGRACLPKVRGLLEHFQRTVEELGMTANSAKGRVSLASVPSFASRLLPDILNRFAESHPDIHITVEDDTAEHVRERVLDGRIDFGIASPGKPSDNLDFEPLITDTMGLVCRRDHPLANTNRGLKWKDLVGETLITNGTCRLLDGTPAQQIMEQAQFAVSNIISLKATLRANLGITALPQLALSTEDTELAFIPLCAPSIERELGIVTRKRRSLSPAAQALRTCIQKSLAVPEESEPVQEGGTAEATTGTDEAPCPDQG